jgi:Cys-tRNA(Pro) deacylase
VTAPAVDAVAALDALKIDYRVLTHGPVHSVEEAAAALDVPVADVVKTLVVRRAEDDFLFVLVPGDRVISWPKLRALLGVSRLSLPDAAEAKRVTGYERGTITVFGATTTLPVIADERIRGRRITLGAGRRGAAFALAADDAVAAVGARLADVTDAPA